MTVHLLKGTPFINKGFLLEPEPRKDPVGRASVRTRGWTGVSGEVGSRTKKGR